jgi:hypothetical protein
VADEAAVVQEDVLAEVAVEHLRVVIGAQVGQQLVVGATDASVAVAAAVPGALVSAVLEDELVLARVCNISKA